MKKSTGEMMSKSLVTISQNRSLGDALQLMEEHRIRHLPVTEDDGATVVGILSDRDVQRAMSPVRPSFLPGQLVRDFMSWPAITVAENTPIADVAEGMIDEKVSAFLVARGEEVVGIVTSEDLLRLLKDVMREEKPSLLATLPYTPVVREAIQELQSAGI